jgi:hypothetical protein
MIYKKGTVFIAAGNNEEHLEEIKKFIKRHGLTQDDVKIVKHGKNFEDLSLIAKREVKLGG